jgi:hypothetical protein
MTCADLAAAQLAAYNAKDLDAFCACYSDDVSVLDADGQTTLLGQAAFRARYDGLFGGWQDVGATVDQRLVLEPHVVDDERWWRRRGDEAASGRVLVRYTARDGKIAVVQFFREAT